MHPQPRVEKNRTTRVSSPRSHRNHPAFPARWFTTYSVLSPVIGLGCHRRKRNRFRPLDASIEASGPHDFAVRIRCCSSAARPRPSHPAPRFVTLRNAPRSEQDGSIARFDLPDGESQIFLPMGLDSNFGRQVICPSGKSAAPELWFALLHEGSPALAEVLRVHA